MGNSRLLPISGSPHTTSARYPRASGVTTDPHSPPFQQLDATFAVNEIAWWRIRGRHRLHRRSPDLVPRHCHSRGRRRGKEEGIIVRWHNEPPTWTADNDTISAATAPRTDFWRKTHYGFIRD